MRGDRSAGLWKFRKCRKCGEEFLLMYMGFCKDPNKFCPDHREEIEPDDHSPELELGVTSHMVEGLAILESRDDGADPPEVNREFFY